MVKFAELFVYQILKHTDIHKHTHIHTHTHTSHMKELKVNSSGNVTMEIIYVYI